MRIKTVLTKTFNIWLGLIYRTKIQEKELVKRLNSQELLSWPCLQRKETELVFIQTLQFILFSLFLRDCCFVEVNARSVACSQPPGRSVCEGMGRVDCKVFWGVPACLSQSLLALPATQKAEFPLAPELPGTCACWSPVWGLPGRAPSSTHSFYIAADWAKACFFCARYTEDRGLAVGHTSLESRWKRLCDPESWVIRLKCRTGSTAAAGSGRGTVPWREWNIWIITLGITNVLFTFQFTYEVNMNSHMMKLKLSVYTSASDPNFPEMYIKKSHWELENVLCWNCCFSHHVLGLVGEGVVLAFQYYWLPLLADFKKNHSEIKIH